MVKLRPGNLTITAKFIADNDYPVLKDGTTMSGRIFILDFNVLNVMETSSAALKREVPHVQRPSRWIRRCTSPTLFA